jgi:hypothetical protein
MGFSPCLEAHGEFLALAVGPGSWLGAQKQLVGEWMVPYENFIWNLTHPSHIYIYNIHIHIYT